MKFRIDWTVIFVITTIFLFLNCVSPSKSERTHIVSVKGAYGGACDNFFCTGYYLPMKDSSTSIPLYHGDFVYTKDFFFRYDSAEGNTLTLENKGALFYVNGRLEGLRIENDSAIKLSLAAVSDKDLALLKSVSISDTIPAAYLFLIRKIAKTNPHIGLCVSSECIFFDTIIPLFDPFWLVTDKKDQSKQVLSSIAHCNHLVMLNVHELLPADLDTMTIPATVRYLSL
jgi:hypothetical protein